jgi:tRNA G18 (ribose-2'-O)-methylase SpoU
MAVPETEHYREALAKGDTLVVRPHIHWITDSKCRWLAQERRRGSRIIGIELGEDAVELARVTPVTSRTVVLLGNESSGLPDEAWCYLDEVVEIPMLGVGTSLNVAVAGSLALYKLAGLC